MKKKLYKVLSVVLSITLLLSVCFVSGAINVFADEKITEYYVGYGGTGDGTSLENMAPNVAAAVDTINANKLGKGDTVTIYIVQNIDRPRMVSEENAVNNKFGIHNLTSWDNPAKHEAKIIVKPYAGNAANYNNTVQCTYLANSYLIGRGEYMLLGGPTEFQDLMIVYNYGTSAQHHVYPYSLLCADGNDLTIGKGVTYGHMPALSNNEATWATTGTINKLETLGISAAYKDGVYTKPFKITLNNPMRYDGSRLDIPFAEAGDFMFKEDFTFEVNESTYLTGFRFGGLEATTTVFEKNINFKFAYTGTGEKELRFFNGTNTLTVNGGVQVIDAGIKYSSQGGATSWDEVTSFVDVNGDIADTWYLKVNAEGVKYLDFVNGETGKFQVPSNCVAVATAANGEKFTSDMNGILNLAGRPGKYTVEIEVYREKVYEYYVKYGGTGDGSSIDAPAPDVATAINTINECRLNETETANIYIMQNITAFENNTTDNDNYYHNLVSWGATVEHDAKVIISAYKDNTYNDTVTNTYLATSPQVGKDTELRMGGPVEFRDVAIFFPYGSNINNYNPIIANGNDVTFTSETTFRYLSGINGKKEANWDLTIPAYANYYAMGVGFAVAGKTVTTPMKVTYNMVSNGAVAQAINFPYGYANANDQFVIKEDVTFENLGTAGLKIRFGTLESSAVSIFEKNLNIKETAGTGYRYIAGSNIVVKGGVQVISSSAVTHNSTDKFENAMAVAYKDEAYTTPADLWKLNVDASCIEYIDFIEGETGKFTVAGNCSVKAVNKANETLVYNVEVGERLLDLAGLPGEYDLEFTVFKEKIYDYYVKAGGTGDGSSADAPASTIAAAINTAKTRRLVKGETATIHVMQDITAIKATSRTNHNIASWGGTVEHEFNVVIKAHEDNTYNGTVQQTVVATNSTLASDVAIALGGPTEFQNIMIFFAYGSNIKNQVPVDFNGESGKLSADTTFAYLPNINKNSYGGWAEASIPADLATEMSVVSMLPVYLASGDGKTFTEFARVEVGVPYTTTSHSMAIFVIGEGANTFKEDITAVLDFTADSYNPRVRMGLSTGGAVFEKNLNIKFKSGKLAGFSSGGPITVKGGVQYILSDAVTFHASNPYNNVADKIYKEDGVTKADMWILKVKSSQIDTVDFVEGETGKFKANIDGRIALATKVVADGEPLPEPIVAVNGVLDLSGAPGEYEISYVTEFSADGETIRTYKDIELDLTTQSHTEKKGKLFIGWKYKDKDEYPQAVNGIVSIKAGSVLEAQYVDKTEADFLIEDIQLRADGNANDPAIRYIINKGKAFEGKLNVTEYGAIYIDADKAEGLEIFMDKESVVSWYAYANESGTNPEWSPRATTGYKPTTAVANPEKILEETETATKYTICLANIPEASYRTFYALRGYIKFNDGNNVPSITYTEQEVSSIYKEACDTNDTAVEDRTETHLDVIAKSEASKAAEKQALMNSLMTPSEFGVQIGLAGQTLTDQEALEKNAIIYTTDYYGRQYLRNITIDTGMDVEATDLLFVTDVHVTYSNEKDIAYGYRNALEFYKARAYYGSDFNSRSNYSKYAIYSANLAAVFDKVVVGGDVTDYVSYGGFEALKRVWSDRNVTSGKSLKGTISITPGNHEGSQSRSGAGERMDKETLYAFQNKYMVSSAEIDYDIVYKADGKTPNYMTVTIDNAQASNSYYVYTEAQYKALSEYLAYAKELNIPVILFQHVPMVTWDEADSEYWYNTPEHIRFENGGRTPHPAVYKQWLKWKSENPNATEKEKTAYADSLYSGGKNDYGESYPTGWKYANLYDGADWAACTGSDATTLKVRQLITSNSDTIKAIITGHNHADYETGVVATDEAGNKLRDKDGNYITIPQYTTAAGYQHAAMIVNIK